MSSQLTIVAFCFDSDGNLIIVDGNRAEYECKTPQQAWDDLKAISEDNTLPSISSKAVSDKDFELTPESLYELGCQQVEDIAETAYGPFGRALAGRAGRAGSKSVLGLLRNLSKRSKYGR